MKKIFSFILCLFIMSCCYSTVRAENDVTEMHWDNTQTIRVYIPKHKYSATLRHAFEYWDRSAGAKLHFIMVNTPEQAQDEVIFVDKLDGNTVGYCQKTYRTKNYGTKEKTELIGLKIYIAMKDPYGKQMERNQIYTIALHEIGHSLGLGHTDNPESIMYPNSYKYGIMEVTKQDMINLHKVYGWRY